MANDVAKTKSTFGPDYSMDRLGELRSEKVLPNARQTYADLARFRKHYVDTARAYVRFYRQHDPARARERERAYVQGLRQYNAYRAEIYKLYAARKARA